MAALGIREVTQGDIESLRPILEEWVRYPGTEQVIEEEVVDTLGAIGRVSSGEDPDKKYYVATVDGRVVGGMGFKADPDEQVGSFAHTERPVEVINAYVSGRSRQSGAGTALIERIKEEARSAGFTELLVNSGPRYEKSGWGFYDKVIGAKLGFIANFYGEGFDAAVWGEEL